MRLVSRFGRQNSIRRESPLADAELMQTVPSVFPETNMNPGANVILIFQPLISSTGYVRKVFSRSLPARVVYVI